MPNLQPQFEREGLGGTEGRLNTLRRQIAFYRQNLRQSSDAEFTTIYAREIAQAESEMACLVKQARPGQR
jgi:hypothetical protein